MNGLSSDATPDGPPTPPAASRSPGAETQAARLLSAWTTPSWRTRWALLAALVAGAAYLELFRLQLEWMGDDGVFTVGALRLTRGEAVYRDFSTHATPGSFYLLAAFGSVFGHTLETSRLAGMILALAVAGAAFLFTHRLTSSIPVALLGFSLTLLPFAYAPSYNHHSLSAVFALAAAGAWFRWLDTRSTAMALTAGLCDGLAGYTSHNKGAFLLLASLSIMLLFGGPGWGLRLRALAAYACGGTAVALLLLTTLLLQGSFPRFLDDCVFFVLRNYADIQSVPYGTLFGMLDARSGADILALEALLCWPAAAPLIAAGLELALYVRNPRGRRPTALLAVHGTILLGAALHRPDFGHLHIVATVPTALLLAQLHALRRKPCGVQPVRRIVSGVPTATLAGLALMAGVAGGRVVADVLATPHHPLPSMGNGVWTSSADLAESVEGVARHLRSRTSPGEPVFVFPHSSAYYLAAGRPNPTRFDAPLESPGREAMIDEVTAALDLGRIRYVVVDTWWTDTMVACLFPRLERSFMKGRFIDYLHRAYEPDLRLPFATVWRRKPE